jgi:hypothetical protein
MTGDAGLIRAGEPTLGGQPGEAYLHGMNGIAEAVRQVRGTSVNQIRGAERMLVTAGRAWRPPGWS